MDRIADLYIQIQGTLKACTEGTFRSPAHAAALTSLTHGPNPVLIIDDIGFSRPVAQRFLDPNIP
ncbi:MAG: hypothetical protein PVH87_13640 [Desulfobacteraceae bacterium]